MEVFLGQLICVGFNFVPEGWASCDGRLLSIRQNTALFSLLGTTYGGDGQSTFGLPDLRGRAPIHASNSVYEQGQTSSGFTAATSPDKGGEIPGYTVMNWLIATEGIFPSRG